MFITPFKRYLKKNYEKMLDLPPGVPKEHHQWIVFANHIDLFAVTANLGFLIVFTHLKMWLLVLNVSVVALSFAVSLLLKMRGGTIYKQCVAVLYIILGIGSCTCTLLGGWNCGFQYYLLALILASFYIPFSSKTFLLFTSQLLFGAFVAVYFLSQDYLPFYSISASWQRCLYLMSVSGFTFTLVYFPMMNHKANQIAIKTISTTLAKNAELERLSKLKDDFLANTSHELRTPLHGISGIAESLCNDPTVKSSSFVSNNLKHILSSARRLTNLVNDILDVSKMRHDDLVIHPRALDVRQIIMSVLPNFSGNAANKGIVISTDVQDGVPLVLADEDRLIQIIFNLLGNALKFTDHGCITIHARSMDAHTIAITVADTGIGIAPGDIERIFDDFEQAMSDVKSYRGGTGLGLSITRKLVELHGGTITVTSIPGEGSAFTVTLPAAPDTVPLPSADEPQLLLHHRLYTEQPAHDIQCIATDALPIQCGGSDARSVVLAIDDEPINLRIIRNHLEQLGITVVTADCGTNIIGLIERYHPLVVLLDIMMPGVNGYECCRLLRSRYSVADLPVIFVSAKNRIEDLLLGFDAGGNDYVLKPFLREELTARVNGFIRQRTAVDAIRENTRLKSELADRLIEEAHLRQEQERLTRLLHTVDDGILVADEHGAIMFVNNCCARHLGLSANEDFTGSDVSCLLHAEARQRNLLTAKLSRTRSTPVLFAHANGSAVEFGVRRTIIEINYETVTVFIMRPPQKIQNQVQVSEWLMNELEKNQARIAELEIISNDCINANREMIKQLTSIECPTSDPFSLGHRIMVESLTLWKETTGREKWDFAECSRLWKIHPDEDGWQRTVTLDKYLDFRKMPRFPRWAIIMESARFALTEAKKRGSRSDLIVGIEQKMNELEETLKAKSNPVREPVEA